MSWSFRRDGNFWAPRLRCRNTPVTSHGVESVEHASMHSSRPEQIELNAITCQYMDIRYIYIYIDRDYILYRLYMQNSTINVFWYSKATSYQSPNTCVNMKFSKNILASSKSLPWSLFTWLPYLLRLAWRIQTLLNDSPFPTFSIWKLNQEPSEPSCTKN